MSEIVITIMILFSALAVRDAIVYECSRRNCVKRLSPMQFAITASVIALILIWILLVPLKRFITGECNKIDFYDKGVSLVISVAFLVCALSLREASCNFFESGSESGQSWMPWAWAFLVIFSTAVLIFSVVVCK